MDYFEGIIKTLLEHEGYWASHPVYSPSNI